MRGSGGRGDGRVWLVAFLAMVAPSCDPGPRPAPPSLLPDPVVARRAVEDALGEWRSAPEADTAAAGRPLIFLDRQRQPGQRLVAFTVLGQTEVDNCRRFVVRLSLDGPEETVLAAYYVFGKDPIWVYRAEDFEMMMHMDMAPDDPGVPAGDGGGRTDGRASTAGARGG